MAKDFKSLLRSIAHQLERQEIEILVRCTHLPEELKNQSAACVLDRLAENGKFSARNLEVLMDAMKEIDRDDLYKEVNTFKKSSHKKLSEDNSNSADNYFNFDIAEIEATRLRNTLQLMEGSEAMAGVKRLEEVYSEALLLRQTAGGSRTSSRISPYPVSLAKALVRSSTQSVNSDCNDSCSCTGDSGFDEYPPTSVPRVTGRDAAGRLLSHVSSPYTYIHACAIPSSRWIHTAVPIRPKRTCTCRLNTLVCAA